MYISTSVGMSMVLIILSLLGWATQTNGLVNLKIQTSLYHFDFIIWRTIWCFVACIVLGTKYVPPTQDDFWENIVSCFHSGGKSILSHIGGVCLAGVTDMLFQIFLFSSVSGSGLSSSVPLQVGSSTLFGSFITLMIDRRAVVKYFVPGVFINLIAVILDAVAYKSLQKDNKKAEQPNQKESKTIEPVIKDELSNTSSSIQPTEEPSKEDIQVELLPQPEKRSRYSMKKVILVGVAGAIVGTPFGPGMALAGQQPHALSPYSSSLLLAAAGALTAPLFSYLMMRFPLYGEKATWKDWWNLTWKQRWPAIWGAFSWTIGTVCYALAAPQLGFAITYIFGQSTPFITSLYSIFYHREFRHAGAITWTYEILMLLSFATSLGLMCFALPSFCVC